jgi:hypothetical protein
MRKRARDMTDEERRALVRAVHARLRAMGYPWNDDGEPRRVRRRDRPRCGARTKSGRPCKAPCVWDRENDQPRNGRCKLHGGLSTGPTTDEGRQRSIEAMQEGHRRWRQDGKM